MANSNPPDYLGDFEDAFADEDSPEFRQARAAIPTRPEIDALFADERLEPPFGGAGDASIRGRPLFGTEDSEPFDEPYPTNGDGTRRPMGRAAGLLASLRVTAGGVVARVADGGNALVERLRAVRAPSWPRSRARTERLSLLDRTTKAVEESPAPPPAVARPAARPGPPLTARLRRKLDSFTRRRSSRGREEQPASWGQVIAATAVLSVATFFLVVQVGTWMSSGSWASASTAGSLTVTTEPSGARVLIDGVEQGVSPARLTVEPGEHILEVRTGEVSKTMPLRIAAGENLSRAFDLKTRAAPGRLEVRSSPAGAQVFVDGRHRGRSPLTLTELSAGQHTVVVQRGTQAAQEVVDVEPGGTASVNLSLAEATASTTGRSAGTLAIRAPVEVEVFEFGRSLGTTRAGRLQLPAGRRELEFVNELFGVRLRQKVDVAADRTTPLTLDIPPGTVTINAIPWADVRIDGRTVGRTPVADLALDAGRHDVILRHPRHGQRRVTIMVNAGAPLVVTTDLTK